MLSSSDFSVQKIAATGFIGVGEFNPASALRYAIAKWPDVYDGNATSLPATIDVPPDFPVVSLASKDGAWLLEMSQARVNVAWLRQDLKNRSMERLFATLARRLAAILDEGGVKAGRLGAIVTRTASLASPGMALAKQFSRKALLDGPLNRPEGFELHAHKTFNLRPDLPVNSWIRIKTAKGGTPDYRYVVVEQDINTLASELETRRFSKRATADMFKAASRELQGILNLYFN